MSLSIVNAGALVREDRVFLEAEVGVARARLCNHGGRRQERVIRVSTEHLRPLNNCLRLHFKLLQVPGRPIIF